MEEIMSRETNYALKFRDEIKKEEHNKERM